MLLAIDAQELRMADRMVFHAPPLLRHDRFGVHHSKFLIITYERGVRVIVHTANCVMPHGECYRTDGV